MREGMALGLYSPEIPERAPDRLFARAAGLGAKAMQFSFASTHGQELPPALPREQAEEIGRQARAAGVAIEAVNGTFNMLEGAERLEEDLRRFRGVASVLDALGCRCMTLCTGSYSPAGMWVYHPDNGGEEAFLRAVAVTKRLLPIAEDFDLRLLVETEASNAICTPERTRRYLDAVASPRLGVVMDCANLFPAGTAQRRNVRPTIERAFRLLGGDVVLAHGKDVLEAEKPAFTAPGLGIVDYPFFFQQLRAVGYRGSLILHGIKQAEQLEPSVRRMRALLEQPGRLGVL